MWQALLVSKEAFNLLSMAKMIALGMEAKIYRNRQALNGGFFQVSCYKICFRAST